MTTFTRTRTARVKVVAVYPHDAAIPSARIGIQISPVCAMQIGKIAYNRFIRMMEAQCLVQTKHAHGQEIV
jgi:hypothetical protein